MTRSKKPSTIAPPWDWTKGVTQSALTLFLSCREQFALDKIEGKTLKGFAEAMEFGTVIHLAIQRQDEVTTGKLTAEELICSICESYHAARFPQLKRLDIDKMTKTLAAAEMLFPAYYDTVREDDEKQRWIAREQLFNVPYKFPLAGGLGSAEILLRGMRDGAYRTSRRDCLGLFETKTKSHIDDNAIQCGLRADLQSMFYLLTQKIEFGETPKELLYNVIRRPGQKFLDRDTYKTFKERIRDDIKKRPEYYCRRWEVAVLDSDLLQFEKTVLQPALYQLLTWWESVKDHPLDRFRSPLHFVNLNALYTKFGTAPLYNLMVLGRHRDYYVRSSVFPELDQEFSQVA